jgi:AbrB family looped-hinge helix DNA binding protein
MANKLLKTTPIVRIKRKMQVTIPAKIARALKLDEGSFLELSIKEGIILLTPIHLKDKISGADFLKAMSGLLTARSQDKK